MSDSKPLRASFNRHGLAFVGTRRVLATVAEMACKLEAHEFEIFRRTVIGELEALKPNGEHADIWKQAVEAAKLDGMGMYGLQRIGLHPTEKADPPET